MKKSAPSDALSEHEPAVTPRLAQLRAFAAVARERSVSRAARMLGVSQPAVTMQIRSLEDAAGIRLFERTGTGVEPTPLGLALMAETSGLLEIEHAAARVLQASIDLRSGVLRIACASLNPGMRLIAEFRRRYPGVELEIAIGNWERVVHAVFERQADVAILTGAPDDDRITVSPFVTQRIVALVPSGHRLARRRQLDLRTLGAQSLIFRSRDSLTQRSIERIAAANGVRLRSTLTLESREAVYEAVRHGLGIGFVFEHASTRSDGTVRIPVVELSQEFSEDVFCLRQRARQRAIAALFALLAEFRAAGPQDDAMAPSASK